MPVNAANRADALPLEMIRIVKVPAMEADNCADGLTQ